MNGDPASDRVRADLSRWGVRLDYASCGPTAHTPIIIQEIKRGVDGKPKHRFSWSCPKCGEWLPGYKAVTTAAVELVSPALTNTSVFFLDRLSRAALSLAKEATKQGAIVVFEPSGKGDEKMLAEAIRLAHVVKYADQRIQGIDGLMSEASATLVEVQTLGEQGLKYRHRLGRTPSNWMHLSALRAPRLSDTCGSGDWLTAGLLSKVAGGGTEALLQSGARGVRDALLYGQALAAWNCGFEGARGGMYTMSREVFDSQVSALMAGRLGAIGEVALEERPSSLVDCPACPPLQSPPSAHGGKVKRKAAA
jgi:fructokinase